MLNKNVTKLICLTGQAYHSRKLCLSPLKLRAKVIDGRAMADEVLREVKRDVNEWISLGNRRPHLTAVLVGTDPASQTYVKNKMIAANLTGISSETLHFNESLTEEDLCRAIGKLNEDTEVDGILVQLPLPLHMNERKICNMVAPEKDVDGFHIVNVGRFCVNQDSLMPATPAGVIELITRAGIETFGKNAVVCGRSKNVGMPIAMLLHSSEQGDATTTICHRNTPPELLKSFTLGADILITATGIPNLITGDMVSEGVVVIDVGVNKIFDTRLKRDRLVGDVDFKGELSYLPVPGGVGPMTVAMLMKNTLKVARRDIIYDHCWGISTSKTHDARSSSHIFAHLSSFE